MLVTVLADRVFNHDVSRREWIGVALTAAGLAFLAATLGTTGDSAHADHGDTELFGYVGLLAAAGLGLVALRGASGLALGVAAGLLWAGSDLTIKALSGKTGELGAGVLARG